MTNAHAPAKVLSSYVDGTLPDGMSLLLASHLTFCPRCRDRVARLEDLGGALLVTSDAEDPDSDCLERVLNCLGSSPSDSSSIVAAASPRTTLTEFPRVPVPLQNRLACCNRSTTWRFLMPGLSECRLDGFDMEEVSILRARPGVRIPSHTHSGDEATLILDGRMRDGDKVLKRGDVAFADKHDNHRPEIVGDETCYCLTVVTGKLRFTGPLGRALNLLNG